MNNYLLNYISTCGLNTGSAIKKEDYYSAFEIIFRKCFKKELFDYKINLTQLKKDSLKWMEILGHVECDYISTKIYICPSQLLLLPARNGHNAMLVGARSEELIEAIKGFCTNNKVSFIKQTHKNVLLLLPDIIKFNTKKFTKYETLYERCKKHGLIYKKTPPTFNPQLIQPMLMEYTCSVDEYEESIINDPSKKSINYDFSKKYFDIDSLDFIECDNSFDKELNLIEDKLNEYKIFYNYWKKGEIFLIDKSWGRYLILSKNRKNVILFDRLNNIIAVPCSVPLPKLIFKSFVLMSGEIPEVRDIKFNGITKKYHLFKDIPRTTSYNYLKNKLNQDIEFNNITL